MKFTEEKLERLSTELLVQEDYPQHLDNKFVHNNVEVKIEEDLLSYLLKGYQSKQLTTIEN